VSDRTNHYGSHVQWRCAHCNRVLSRTYPHTNRVWHLGHPISVSSGYNVHFQDFLATVQAKDWKKLYSMYYFGVAPDRGSSQMPNMSSHTFEACAILFDIVILDNLWGFNRKQRSVIVSVLVNAGRIFQGLCPCLHWSIHSIRMNCVRTHCTHYRFLCKFAFQRL